MLFERVRMAISGLVVQTNDADSSLDQLRTQLSRDDRFDIGEPADNRLPVVMSTASVADDRDLYDWLQAQPTVTHVDVVFVDCHEPRSPATDSNHSQSPSWEKVS